MLSQINESMKRVYPVGAKVLIEQQNMAAPTFSKIKVSKIKPSAAGVYNAVTMSNNESGINISPAGTWAAPEAINVQQPTITPKTYVTPFEIDVGAIELSETNAQAFAPNLDMQMKNNFSVGYSDLNRQILGKGNGQMTLANGAGVATATLVVDNALVFRRGMYIEGWTGATLEIASVRINAVNPTTNTLTLAAVRTWSDNAIITRTGARDVTGASTELMGVQGVADTTAYSTTFEGLAVASNPEWIGNVVDAGGASVSQGLLLKTYNRIKAIGNGKPNLLISQFGQSLTFQGTELNKTRYEAGEVKAGATILKWQDLDWVIEKDYDIGEVGMYDLDNLEKFQTKDLHIMDTDGSSVIRLSRQDAVGGYLRYQGNLGTWARNKHGRLTGLVEPAL